MVEFNTLYYHPLDRKPGSDESSKGKKLEDPIIPIGELGITVSERASKGNLVQGVQAAFRKGVGKIQLVMDMSDQIDHPGAGPKIYGKEVRERIREVILANEGVVTGVELPPLAITNLNGGINLHDPQEGGFSESIRQKQVKEVKEHVRFVREALGGGEVDIVSWEYPRTVFDAPWNSKNDFFKPEEKEDRIPIQFVDPETGKIQAFNRNRIPAPEGEKDLFWDFDRFKKHAESKGADIYDEIKNALKDRQMRQFDYEQSQAEREKRRFEQEKQIIEKNAALSKEQKEKQVKDLNRNIETAENYIQEQERKKEELNKRLETWKEMRDFAKEKTIQSYAETGIFAMEESRKPGVRTPIAVGPELGWPHAYGGHPQEFKETIQKAREKMVEMLTADKIKSATGQSIDNPDKMSKKEAEEEARMHIKGTFDTAHVGMWLESFRPDLPWDKRVKEFNKWYLDQVKDLAKTDTVGTVQLVNSNGAGHGHLPPGEGIFPVIEAAKVFKKHGFAGHMVSEGHMEEQFGEGRIFTKTWEAFDAPIFKGGSSGYHSAPTFGEVSNAYFGRQYPPTQMFGSYTPPMSEYRPWAGGKNPIPFE